MNRATAHRGAGFTLIEVILTSLIIGVLGAALVSALNVSLMAFGTSSAQASMQTSGRLVMSRTMRMIRNASLHDAYDPSDSALTLVSPTSPSHPLNSVGIQFIQDDGKTIYIWWAVKTLYGDADLGDLWIRENSDTPQILIERVRCQREGTRPYVFTLSSRSSDGGLLLDRATLALEIQAPGADDDTATGLEKATAKTNALRLVSSTMPRRNLD